MFLKLSSSVGLAFVGVALIVAPVQAGEAGAAAAAAFEFSPAPTGGSVDLPAGSLNAVGVEALTTAAAIGKMNAIAGATRDPDGGLTASSLGSGGEVTGQFNSQPEAFLGQSNSSLAGGVDNGQVLPLLNQENTFSPVDVTPGLIDIFSGSDL